MNWKTVWATISAVAAVVGLAVAHNIDAIVAHPGTIVTIVFGAISGWLFGHKAGMKAFANGKVP